MPSCSKSCAPSQELEDSRDSRPADVAKNGSTAAAGKGSSKPRASELPLGPIDFDLMTEWKRDLGFVVAVAIVVGVLVCVADALFGGFFTTFAGQW